MIELQLGKLPEKRTAHAFLQGLKGFLLFPAERVEKETAPFNPPIPDQAMERQDRHGFRGFIK